MRQEKGDVELWGGWLFVVVIVTVLLIMGLLLKTAFASSGGLLFESSPQLESCVTDGGDSRGSCGWEKACLAKMEAAMRAMEEFTPKRVAPFPPNSSNSLIYITPCTSDECLKRDRLTEAENEVSVARAELDKVKRREGSISQWATVKRECWTKE